MYILYYYERELCCYDKVEHLKALPQPYRLGYLFIRKGVHAYV